MLSSRHEFAVGGQTIGRLVISLASANEAEKNMDPAAEHQGSLMLLLLLLLLLHDASEA
jgi:hypothetical protein